MLHRKRKRLANQGVGRFRSGLAVVEFAVCLPILVIIVFGSIEACNAVYLKQAVTAAAYEAARVATGTGGTKIAAQTRGEEILSARTINGATVTFDPPLETSWLRGSRVSVTVSVPADQNLNGIQLFFSGQDWDSTVVMVKQ